MSMDEIFQRRWWASVKSNHDFTYLQTQSGFKQIYVPDPEGEEKILPHSVSDRELGLAVRNTLNASRIVDYQSNPFFFDSRGRIVPEYQVWVQKIMEQFGYKTKRAMFKYMKHCSVELFNGTIKLEPWHHAKLEAWDGTGITEADTVSIPADSTDEEIGAALRLALSRCT